MNDPVERHEQTNPFTIMVQRSDFHFSQKSPRTHQQIAYPIQAGLDTQTIVSAFATGPITHQHDLVTGWLRGCAL